MTRDYVYEVNGPIQSIEVDGPSGLLAEYSYTYDDVLNVDTLLDDDGTHDYDYDGLNRLTQANHPPGLGLSDESYIYDDVGNRKDAASPSQWQYDGNNRIVQAVSLTYTFDADGNLSARSDGATFTHDARNRLAQYTLNMVTATYLHDPLGRRIAKTVDSVITWFLWDGARLLAEYDSAGVRDQRYSYLGDDYAPLQVEDANGTYYVHADHLETPRLLTDASASSVWTARFGAYGAAVVDDDPDGNGQAIEFNVRLPGQYFDSENGLHYNYHRVYSPQLGRYLETDPLGLSVDPNLYIYAMDNPLRYIDSNGLNPAVVGISVKLLCEFGGDYLGKKRREYVERIRQLHREKVDVIEQVYHRRLEDCQYYEDSCRVKQCRKQAYEEFRQLDQIFWQEYQEARRRNPWPDIVCPEVAPRRVPRR